MTLAQKLKQEGRQEGLEQGLQTGRHEGVLTGQIRAYQEVLGEAPTPEDVLLAQTISDLESQLAEIKAQVAATLKS